MHYVIIGNGVAGMTAANTIRGRDEDSRITLVSYEHDHFFSRTALMYAFCGQLSDRCIEPYERDHYQRMKFERVRDRVTGLDASSRSLRLQSGDSLTYDRLLIASGSLPLIADWPGIDLDGVGNFVTWQDLEWLRDKAKNARRAVIVGGGLIGIEAAEILLTAGVDVTFLIREDWFWPIALNPEEGNLVSDHMTHHGIDVRLKTEMKQVLGKDGKVVGVETTSGERIDTDLVIITIGVGPQTEFLSGSGLEMGERGGIAVNDRLETNLDNIWAAGDCTEVKWFNGIRRPEQLWYTSRDQGKIAGLNLLGDRREYKRGTFYNSAKFFDIEYTTAGLVNFNFEGEENWFQRKEGHLFTERIVYLQNGQVTGFNMLGRRWDHRILVQWIEERRDVEWVLEHLHEALFDEEFMPQFKRPAGISSSR